MITAIASTLIPVADTRQTIADYVGAVFLVYLVILIIRVLLSWIPRMPYNRTLRAVVTFIEEVSDPYLNVFRKYLPPVGSGAFALDLSPILAIILLVIAQRVVVSVIAG